MSTRRRSLLPALALAAVLAIVAAASVAGLAFSSDETASAAVLGHPKPFHRPARQTVPTSTLGQRAARFALREVGVPYRWGGESPSGFDCSGLVRWSYLRVGIDLPHSSYALFGQGRWASAGHMKPGDVLFFDGLGHVGLYVGHGRMIHAPYTGRDVEVVTLSGWSGHLIAARRIAPA